MWTGYKVISCLLTRKFLTEVNVMGQFLLLLKVGRNHFCTSRRVTLSAMIEKICLRAAQLPAVL